MHVHLRERTSRNEDQGRRGNMTCFELISFPQALPRLPPFRVPQDGTGTPGAFPILPAELVALSFVSSWHLDVLLLQHLSSYIVKIHFSERLRHMAFPKHQGTFPMSPMVREVRS